MNDAENGNNATVIETNTNELVQVDGMVHTVAFSGVYGGENEKDIGMFEARSAGNVYDGCM